MKKINLLKALTATLIIVLAVWALPAGTSMAYTSSTGTVVPASAKIRSSAGSSADVIGSAAKGTAVTIVDESKDESGTLWYKITVNGNTGYIRSDLVTKGDATDTKATDTKATDTKANDTKASDTKATDTKATDTKASDIKATDTKASDTKASDTKASDTKAAQTAVKTAAATTIDGAALDLSVLTKLPENVTAMDAQYVTVNVASGKVRSDASTNADLVDTLTKDSKMIAIGTKADSSGKSWYYTVFTGNDGSQKNGFIRSDLVTAGDALPKAEASTEESTETASESSAAPNSDYQLVYADDGSGASAWYLYDNKNGTKMKADELMDYVTSQPTQEKANESKIKQYRMIIIILCVVTVAFLIGIIILAVKLRGTEYEYEPDDDDDDDDEDEDDENDDDDRDDKVRGRDSAERRHVRQEDDRPQHRSRDDGHMQRRPREDNERPVRQRQDDMRPQRGDDRPVRRPVRDNDVNVQHRTRDDGNRPQRRPVDDGSYRPQRVSRDDVRPQRRIDDDDRASRRPRTDVPTSRSQGDIRPQARKAKNFISDDTDDLDFEFINIDDNKK